MPAHIQIQLHPDVQTDNNVPDVIPHQAWSISYKTNLFIDGRYVLKFKVSMLIRKDAETDPTYTYARYMRFGFLPIDNKDSFYRTCFYCYQTAIIEFNKSLDIVFEPNRFIDAQFLDQNIVNTMVDNALNPRVN